MDDGRVETGGRIHCSQDGSRFTCGSKIVSLYCLITVYTSTLRWMTAVWKLVGEFIAARNEPDLDLDLELLRKHDSNINEARNLCVFKVSISIYNSHEAVDIDSVELLDVVIVLALLMPIFPQNFVFWMSYLHVLRPLIAFPSPPPPPPPPWQIKAGF